MRPFCTSLPVANIAARLRTKGSSLSRGSAPAAASACSSRLSGTTRGITRIPASLSPGRTAVLPCRVAMMISPMLFTAHSRSSSTWNRPANWAVSSILPSFTWPRSMPGPLEMAHSRSAASFSWSIPGCISHTYRCSLPMDSSMGMSSSRTTCPLRNWASLYWSLTIRVRSWHNTCPTASTVLICFMVRNPSADWIGYMISLFSGEYNDLSERIAFFNKTSVMPLSPVLRGNWPTF